MMMTEILLFIGGFFLGVGFMKLVNLKLKLMLRAERMKCRVALYTEQNRGR